LATKASARSIGGMTVAGVSMTGAVKPSTCSAAKTGVARAKSRVSASSLSSEPTVISL
jgi:hypothetical protein